MVEIRYPVGRIDEYGRVNCIHDVVWYNLSIGAASDDLSVVCLGTWLEDLACGNADGTGLRTER